MGMLTSIGVLTPFIGLYIIGCVRVPVVEIVASRDRTSRTIYSHIVVDIPIVVNDADAVVASILIGRHDHMLRREALLLLLLLL